jgi:predicted metal-dependent hydrolase
MFLTLDLKRRTPMKKDKMKEIVVTVDRLPSKIVDQVGEIAERAAETVIANELQILRNEIRVEITELKAELFKSGLVPAYRTAYKPYNTFDDSMVRDKFEELINDLSLKTGRSPRAIRIRMKNLGLLGV